MRSRSFFYLALVVLLASSFSSSTIGQQAPAGRQGGAAPGARQGGPPPVQLAEGAGREQVQAACARCHGLNLIANSWGYTKDGWQDRIATMVKLPPAELEAISTYLAAHYPIKDAPGAVLISGPATVTIKEWMAQRSGRGRTIHMPQPTDRSGGPASTRASSDVSIRGPARSASSMCLPTASRTV